MDHSGGDVDMGEAVCVETGSILELSLPSSQFCCEPTTALKNKVLKKSKGHNIIIEILEIQIKNDPQFRQTEITNILLTGPSGLVDVCV